MANRRPLLGLLGALTLGAAACGTVAQATATAPPLPAPVQDTLTLLAPWLDNLVAARHLPGMTVVVVRGATPLWSRQVGFADLGCARPLGPDDRFFAGSVSKLFTALAALQLRDAGRLDLDAPLARYLPDLALADDRAPAITVRDLLTHRSGLRREAPTPYWMTYDFPDWATLRAELATLPLDAPPGTRTAYSNVGMAVLGQVIAAAAGEPYAAYLDRHLLTPLGLRHTTAAADGAARSTVVTPYSREKRHLHGARRVREHGDPRAMTPAFGLITSAHDLAALASFFLGARQDGPTVLAPASVAEMFTPQDALAAWTEARGLGFELVRRKDHLRAAHNGWFSGHRLQLSLVPDLGLGVVVLANADDAPVSAVADRILDDLIDALVVAAARGAAPPSPLDPALTGLAGLYGAGWVPDRDVVALSDGLWQYVPEPSPDVPLRHGLERLLPDGPGDAFRVGHADGQPVHFSRDERGRGLRLWLEDGTVWLDRRP